MRVVKWSLGTGFAGATHRGEFEVDGDTTDEEIEEMAREAAFNCIDWNYEVEESEVE